PEFAKFPVNFPVSREFGAETSSQLTASSATQSREELAVGVRLRPASPTRTSAVNRSPRRTRSETALSSKWLRPRAKDSGVASAGITTYNALRHSGAMPGDLVAVLGVGGLGHLGIQFANKFGYKVVAIGRGSESAALAKKLGA